MTPTEIIDFCAAPLRQNPTILEQNARRLLYRRPVPGRASKLILDSVRIGTSTSALAWRRGKLLCTNLPPRPFIDELSTEPGLATLATGRGTYIAAVRRRIPILSLGTFPRRLLEAIAEGNEAALSEEVQSVLSRYQRAVRRGRISAFLTTANYSPGIRLLSLAAKREGIPVLLYPHGVLGNPQLTVQMDGGMTDYWLSWTQGEAESILSAGIPAAQIEYIGPYRELLRCGPPSLLDGPSVLILGVRRNSREEERAQMVAAESIGNACIQAGLAFRYRAHPLQDLGLMEPRSNLSNHIDSTASLEESVCASDLVVGPPTTALLEAKYAGRLAIEIERTTGDRDAVPSGSKLGHLRLELSEICSLIGQPAFLRDEAESMRTPPNDAPARLQRFLRELN